VGKLFIPEFIPTKVRAIDVESMEALVLEQRKLLQAAELKLEHVAATGHELRGKLKTTDDDQLKNFEILCALIEENEQLKSAEKEFRASCRQEKEKVSNKLLWIKGDIDDLEEDITALLEALKRLQIRLARGRVSLAGVSRMKAVEARLEDDQPLREELVQFERQFAELYEQMTQKYDEHRRHVATYNALDTKLRLLRDQLLLIKSISESYLVSKSSMRSATEFSSQFSQVLKGFDKSLHRSQEKLSQVREERDVAETELQTLLLKQRRYYRAVRDLQDAFIENERLFQALTSRKTVVA
jgi:hypothetical protein